ncbi:hypothetical protein HELRODRAFT_179624 [Helobdella robusta]|uniref:Uncharacterized protein n=1 Tax=Helobdella robusta TaxID=6412 RepID=T1FEY3_HELRO|nr:hypothetical protein HELRODRAFT_179624 [Helobdella robusta]ESN95280.1 hypothetical protein HELRODRAFT_179624 [Helobdella robusta]
MYNGTQWNGKTVKLQIAKESFLDRLARERQATTSQIVEEWTPTVQSPPISTADKSSLTSVDNLTSKLVKTTSEQIKTKKEKPPKNEISEKKNLYLNDTERLYTTINNDMNKTSNKALTKQEASDLKRLQSLRVRDEGHSQQVDLIRKSLHAETINKKVIFKSDSENSSSSSDDDDDDSNDDVNDDKDDKNKKKLSLFDDGDEEEDDVKKRFDEKSHFEGKKGEKLFRLQMKIKDSRFRLDEKFASNDQSGDSTYDDDDDDDDDSANHSKPKKMKLDNDEGDG